MRHLPIAIIAVLMLSVTMIPPGTVYAGEAITPSDVKAFCKQKWADDFVMQKHCVGQQQTALQRLSDEFNRLVKQEHRLDETLYAHIVGRCIGKHEKNDAVMIEYCTRQQIEAYFALQKGE